MQTFQVCNKKKRLEVPLYTEIKITATMVVTRCSTASLAMFALNLQGSYCCRESSGRAQGISITVCIALLLSSLNTKLSLFGPCEAPPW